MNCISLMQCVSETAESIALKIHRHACWHVLRHCTKFGDGSPSGLKMAVDFVFFVVLSLLFFRRFCFRHVEITNVDFIGIT